MNNVTIPILVDGTSQLAEIRLTRTCVGCEGQDTWEWEWGILRESGYERIDSGELQHGEHLGLFNLFHRILSLVLGKREAR